MANLLVYKFGANDDVRRVQQSIQSLAELFSGQGKTARLLMYLYRNRKAIEFDRFADPSSGVGEQFPIRCRDAASADKLKAQLRDWALELGLVGTRNKPSVARLLMTISMHEQEIKKLLLAALNQAI